MHAKAFSSFTCVVILIGLPACDNVEWGGMQVSVVPPEPASRSASPDGGAEPPPEPLDLGPILLMVEPWGGSHRALPVAEITPEGYVPLPSSQEVAGFGDRLITQHLPPGAEFLLLGSRGRVGSFLVQGLAATDADYCAGGPMVEGAVELRPGTDPSTAFPALRREAVPWARSEGGPGPPEGELDAVASDAVATRLLTQLGAPLPPSIPDIRQDLQPISLGGQWPIAMAASFLYDDELAIGDPSGSAYALFFLAVPDPGGGPPRALWYWYQRQDGGSKAWPRLWGLVHREPPAPPDLVLEVFGRESRSVAILGLREGGWELVFESPCREHTEPDRVGTEFP
jgi:hypothetical protein